MQRLLSVVVLIAAGLGGCAGPRPPTNGEIEACRDVQKTLNSADDTFVARVKEIRSQHILVVEYDREMIAALTAYRDVMRGLLYDDETSPGSQWRCTGAPLSDLKLAEEPKLERVQRFLGTFERAVREDPSDVYVP